MKDLRSCQMSSRRLIGAVLTPLRNERGFGVASRDLRCLIKEGFWVVANS